MTQVQLKPKAWAKAAAIRAVKTMAQTFLAMTSMAAVLADVDWRYVGSAVVMAGILSMVTSLAGLPEVE